MAICERCGESPAAPNDEWCNSCILEVEALMADFDEPNGDQPPPLPRNTYTRDDLERWIMRYETKYGISSETLLALHQSNKTLVDLPEFDRHVWLSYYRELLESQ